MPSQFPDTTVQVTPGTTATFAIERIKGTLYQPILLASAYGDIIGRRDAYVATDHKQLGVASRWILNLKNDASATFVEVSKVSISQGTTAVLTGTWQYAMLFRLSAVSGGSLSTAVRFDTSSPDLSTQSRIKARRGSAATTAGLINMSFWTTEESGGFSTVDLFDEAWTGEPILLRQGEGVGIQWSPAAGVGIYSAHIYFRTRYQ